MVDSPSEEVFFKCADALSDLGLVLAEVFSFSEERISPICAGSEELSQKQIRGGGPPILDSLSRWASFLHTCSVIACGFQVSILPNYSELFCENSSRIAAVWNQRRWSSSLIQ